MHKFCNVRSTILSFATTILSFATTHRKAVLFALGLMIALSITHLEGAFHAAAAATSFSIDLSNVLDIAAQLFNGLFPIFGIVLGVTMGVGIILLVVNKVSSVFGRG